MRWCSRFRTRGSRRPTTRRGSGWARVGERVYLIGYDNQHLDWTNPVLQRATIRDVGFYDVAGMSWGADPSPRSVRAAVIEGSEPLSPGSGNLILDTRGRLIVYA